MISAPSPAEAELGRFKRAGVISAPPRPRQSSAASNVLEGLKGNPD